MFKLVFSTVKQCFLGNQKDKKEDSSLAVQSRERISQEGASWGQVLPWEGFFKECTREVRHSRSAVEWPRDRLDGRPVTDCSGAS